MFPKAMNTLFRRQVFKLKLLKNVLEIQNLNCCLLNKQFNDTYRMIDDKYDVSDYSISYHIVEESFNKLPDSELDKVEDMLRLF